MNKSQQVLSLFEESKEEILDVNVKNEVESYPYGRLRTKAFFWIEFKKNKGFRSGFQTIDPKTGRINAPKYGTYYSLVYQVKDEKGFIINKAMSVNGFDSVNEVSKFIYDNNDKLNLNSDMISQIVAEMLATIKISYGYTRGDKDKTFAVIKPTIDILIKMSKSKDYKEFKDVFIDTKKLQEIALDTI